MEEPYIFYFSKYFIKCVVAVIIIIIIIIIIINVLDFKKKKKTCRLAGLRQIVIIAGLGALLLDS
jgi:hypothetical protein